MKKIYKDLGNAQVEIASLITFYLPEFTYERKEELFKKALEFHERKVSGNIRINQITMDMDNIQNQSLEKYSTTVYDTADFFDYAKDVNTSSRNVWWMNFADPDVFGYYGGRLFAQDELQVMEHPLLGSVRKYLLKFVAENLTPKTVMLMGKQKTPTPILIEDVPQWIKVDTNAKLENGKQVSIYGNHFSSASEEEIKAGVTICKEEIKNNIMAISAPYGEWIYERSQIEQILFTLLCAFSKAKAISKEKKCVIHGGSWGCGAYGGNPELMYFCQMYAATVCEIDELFLHGISGDKHLNNAKAKLEAIGQENSFDSILDYLDN